MLKTGQLPKFEEGLFKTVEPDENRTLYLIPTAEVSLTALHNEENPGGGDATAALHGSDTLAIGGKRNVRQGHEGPLPQHQFEKVELVKIATPGQSVTRSSSRWSERRDGAAAASTARTGWSSAASEIWVSARPRATISSVAARTESLPRDLVVLELRRLRRAAGGDPVSPRERRARRVLRHLNGSGLRSPHR